MTYPWNAYILWLVNIACNIYIHFSLASHQQLQGDGCKNRLKDFYVRIQPILLYSSEIWELIRLEQLERIHMLACKRLFGVSTRPPDKIVLGDLGRHPPFINSLVNSVCLSVSVCLCLTVCLSVCLCLCPTTTTMTTTNR